MNDHWRSWKQQSFIALQWRHNGRDNVSNHQPHYCFPNRLFRRRSKETSKLRVTGLCAGNSPGTGEFPAQMASYAENVSIWWSHHEAKYEMWIGFVDQFSSYKPDSIPYLLIMMQMFVISLWRSPYVVQNHVNPPFNLNVTFYGRVLARYSSSIYADLSARSRYLRCG